MAATNNSSLGHGSSGSPQSTLDELIYPSTAKTNELGTGQKTQPQYEPSPKHEPGHNWGSENPIKTQAEGQKLLDSGYKSGKQIYNVTDKGVIVKFQPDNGPNNGYHAYKVSSPRDIPSTVLKQMLEDGKITKTEFNKLRKGKGKK